MAPPIMKLITPFLNPIQWFKAGSFARKNRKADKVNYDLELYLYSKVLTNNMLHYGYFEDVDVDPKSISFQDFEDAQKQYWENIIALVEDKDKAILDVGCGLGGLSQMLNSRGYPVESLTPNLNQIEYIKQHYPELTTHHSNYEHYEAGKRYGTIINSESLQYVFPLEAAFNKTEELIAPGGNWIICDYFSLGDTKKPHNLKNFHETAEQYGWDLEYEQDITPNILPTLSFVTMYANRFIFPLKHYGYEKLKHKRPRLYYLTQRIRDYIDGKLEKEVGKVRPETFQEKKKYVLLKLKKR